MTHDTVQLDGGNSSILLRVHPHPRLLYWGPRLSTGENDDALTLAEPGPVADVPWPPAAALLVEGYRHRGSSAELKFETHSVEHQEGEVHLRCVDAHAELELDIHITLEAKTGVLGAQLRLTNQGNAAYQVRRLGLTLPLAERALEVMGFHGEWLQTFQTHRIQPQYGSYLQEYRHRHQHDQFPGIVLGTPNFSEQHGEVWGAHLAWGGDYRLQIATGADGRRLLQAEALHQHPERILEPGNTCETPWLFSVYGPQGLNSMSQSFHQFVRQHRAVRRGTAQRPVQLNLPRALWELHARDDLRRMSSRASALGIERFIMEIGRTCHTRNPSEDATFELADGQVSAEDIRQLIDHVHDHCMQFGIWLAPERLMADDTCRQRHPEWVLRLSPKSVPESQAEYVLNLTQPEAWKWLFEQMDKILTDYHINYVKWEFSRELVLSCHEEIAHDQMERAMAMLDQLHMRHPETEFEPCVIGSGHIDYSLLRYIRRFWASSECSALDQQRIQHGLSYFFPPEVIGTHVSTAHTSTRKLSLSIPGMTALFGHMGLMFDVLQLSRESQAYVTRYVTFYKQLRGLLHVGQCLRIETLDTTACLAGGIFGPRNAIIGVVQLRRSRFSRSDVIRLPGLDPEKNYQIHVLDASEEVAAQRLPWMSEPRARISGQWLMQAGLRLPVMPPETALLIEVTVASDGSSVE